MYQLTCSPEVRLVEALAEVDLGAAVDGAVQPRAEEEVALFVDGLGALVAVLHRKLLFLLGAAFGAEMVSLRRVKHEFIIITIHLTNDDELIISSESKEYSSATVAYLFSYCFRLLGRRFETRRVQRDIIPRYY
jgi:hypothetical protein